MAPTRFYFSASNAPDISPALGGMTRTADADRRIMSPTKDGTTLANHAFFGGTSPAGSNSALNRQFVSDRMGAGVVFSTSDTFKGVIRCVESATNDDISRIMVILRVFSEDGSTLRATLKSFALGGVNEWATSLTNRQFSGTADSAGYTTVANDRLVLDVDARVDGDGGTSTTGNMNFGSSAGADLAEDETSTTANDPWFEITTDCFPAASGQPTTKRWGGVTFAGSRAPAQGIQQWTKRVSGLFAPAPGRLIHG